jgi:hypothetical protein
MEDVRPKDAVGERELVDCIVSILLKRALGVVLESAYQSKGAESCPWVLYCISGKIFRLKSSTTEMWHSPCYRNMVMA